MLFVKISTATAESQGVKITEYEPKYAPDEIAIFDEENKKHFLEEYEGKTVLLVFWATWCSPCTAEMPDLDALQKDFRKLPFKVLPISEDYNGIEPVKEFFKTYDLRHLPMMHDYKNTMFKAFDIVGLPTSILINAEGMSVARFMGSINWYDEQVRDVLLKYIPGNPVVPKNSYKDTSLNQTPVQPAVDVKEGTPQEEKSEATDTKFQEQPKIESKNEQLPSK